MVAKKTPMRMCIGCREMKPKNELIRVVKTPNDEILLDVTGKLSGRGAYICKCVECLNKAEKANAFSKNFSMKVENAVYEGLREELEKIE